MAVIEAEISHSFLLGLDEEAGSPLTYVFGSLTGAAKTLGTSISRTHNEATVLFRLLQPFLPKAILHTLQPVGKPSHEIRGLLGST